MNKTIIILLVAYTFLQAQTTWFPNELNVQPFTANFIEPKAGFSFSLDNNDIRLDIGTSQDFYHSQSGYSRFSLGADLFTYTRLRSTSEFHFPVEAIDYLFGINAGYKMLVGLDEYGFRVRISHISAHFVDGQYDHSTDDWIDDSEPRVYSREFLEFFPYFRSNGLRLYTGYTYLIHVTPDYLGKSIFQAGFDYYLLNSGLPFTPFAAYDFKLAKIEKYEGNHIVSAGIKFGEYDKKGFSILFSYFAGRSVHGEYFDVKEKYSTIGFNLDI